MSDHAEGKHYGVRAKGRLVVNAPSGPRRSNSELLAPLLSGSDDERFLPGRKQTALSSAQLQGQRRLKLKSIGSD